jgi:hypothetical protein
MQRVDGGVANSFVKVSVPDRKTYADERIARRKLLVLLAGAATTDDPAAQHNESDFTEACFVLNSLFKCPITRKPGMGVTVTQEAPNQLLQTANEVCKSIVRHDSIRSAIEAVTGLLLESEPEEDGVCRVYRNTIVEVCQHECGAMRTQNEWSTWIDAE